MHPIWAAWMFPSLGGKQTSGEPGELAKKHQEYAFHICAHVILVLLYWKSKTCCGFVQAVPFWQTSRVILVF